MAFLQLKPSPCNWIWLFEWSPGDLVIVSESFMRSWGDQLRALALEPRTAEGPLPDSLATASLIILQSPAQDGAAQRQWTQLLRQILQHLRPGGLVVVLDRQGPDEEAERPGPASMHVVRRLLKGAGLRVLRAYRTGPARGAAHVVVPDVRAARSAFLGLDTGLTRVTRLRASIARLAPSTALPSFLLVAQR